mmetsp:Transcript_30630/g.30254  ORF Transcript_30630/g.30254 Transcript_30630/m.30254 type:complete len:286 (+) Transcript_30630:13-870(+)
MDLIIRKLGLISDRLPKSVAIALTIIGAIKVACILKTAISNTFCKKLCWPLNLSALYGSYSRVLITEASTPIGQAWAEQFASKNFNLLLVGSDENSLAKLKVSLQLKYRVNIETLVIDLCERDASELVCNFIEEKNFEISVVVNIMKNVQIGKFRTLFNSDGKIEQGAFKEMVNENALNIIQANIVFSTLVVRSLLPKLAARKYKSAVINCNLNIESPYSSVYDATKEYLKIFTLKIAKETKKRVDVFSTSYNEGAEKRCVDEAMRNIGRNIEAPKSLSSIFFSH